MALPVTNTGLLKSINGVSVPEPSAFQEGIQAINDEDAGRSQSGRMYVGLIGNAKTLNISWNAIPVSDAYTILRAAQAQAYFPVTYYDSDLAEYTTKTFYIGDRTIDIIQFFVNNERANLSFGVIERL